MSHDDHAHPPSDGDPQPTAYTLRGTLCLTRAWSEPELQRGADAFLAELVHSLRERGCRLIGHIKGILETGEKGQLFLSVTSFEERARYKGGLTGGSEEVDLTLNVIVYGVGSEEVEQLVLAGLQRHLGQVVQRNEEAKGET